MSKLKCNVVINKCGLAIDDLRNALESVGNNFDFLIYREVEIAIDRLKLIQHKCEEKRKEYEQ